MKGAFIIDVAELRRRARQHIEEGAVTPGYRANREQVLKLLNDALATEIVCALRYMRHRYMAAGRLSSETVAQEFLEHAQEEQAHADRIAERIAQLGGAPDLNPAGLLSRSHSEYVEGETLREMIREDLVAERIAIDAYAAIVRYLGDDDSTSRLMMEEVLAKEEEHADDLLRLLDRLEPEH